MEKIVRYESLFGKNIKIQDASHITRERKTSSNIKIVKVEEIMNKDSTFIGFGKPNVFIASCLDGEFYKFDAKSIKRAESKIVDTKGWVQSGLIFELKNLSDDARNDLYKAAKHFEGTKMWTCVNANARLLEFANFTSGKKPLSSFYFPMDLAKNIIDNGLYYKSQKIELSIIKTVPSYLENFGFSVIKSQFMTLYRHSSKYITKKSGRNKIFKLALQTKESFKKYILRKKESTFKIEDHVTLFPKEKLSKSNINMLVSNPGKFGFLLRLLWGPHTFFQVENSNIDIDIFLPKKLKEYERKEKNWFTFLKKNILFSRLSVNFIRRHLAKSMELVENNSEKELFNMLRTHTEKNPHKYNLVITGKFLQVIKINIKYSFIDWILSKHVLLSGYSDDVRYACEFWKESDGNIYFNDNSGTYAPDSELIDNAKSYLNKMFPNTPIIGVVSNKET